MKKNLLYRISEQSISQMIIFWRNLRFAFVQRTTISSDFLHCKFDNLFSNSLIEIDFYYKNLIYISVAGLKKKLYNGKLVLNARNVQFPLKISVVTGNGYFHYSIEGNSSALLFNTNKAKVADFKNQQLDLAHPYKYNPSPIFQNLKEFSNADFYAPKNVEINKPEIRIRKKQLTINHSHFNITENL